MQIGSPCGVVPNMWDGDVVVSEFELHYVHVRYEPPYPLLIIG